MTIQSISPNTAGCSVEPKGTHSGWGAQFGSKIFSAVARVARYFQLRRSRKQNRDAFQHMLALDDVMLKDIGVTRDDVKWANSLPIDINAGIELEKCRGQRIHIQ